MADTTMKEAGGTKSVLRKDIPPSQTLYIKNLNEKIKKQDLRKALYTYFSQYGAVLDVVALKNNQMKGQAFVVFQDVVTASNAMRESQNFVFFGRALTVQYAKAKSDIVARMDGTYVAPDKRKVDPPVETRRKKADAL